MLLKDMKIYYGSTESNNHRKLINKACAIANTELNVLTSYYNLGKREEGKIKKLKHIIRDVS